MCLTPACPRSPVLLSRHGTRCIRHRWRHAAHFLVLTAALTEQTRGLLGRQNLAHLPDGACVINIARGGLIDLDTLGKEVQRGRLRCALDVTDPQEPLPAGHPLRTM